MLWPHLVELHEVGHLLVDNLWSCSHSVLHICSKGPCNLSLLPHQVPALTVPVFIRVKQTIYKAWKNQELI